MGVRFAQQNSPTAPQPPCHTPSQTVAVCTQELRAQFLACRELWHGELVAELDDAGSPYDYLKRLTDVHRLHLFDVVMQYRAIFSDHSSTQVRRPQRVCGSAACPHALWAFGRFM